MELRNAVIRILMETGVECHLRGYEYLLEAILICWNDRKHIHMATRTLYPAIAERFDTIPQSVERNIRTAISRSRSKQSNIGYIAAAIWFLEYLGY